MLGGRRRVRERPRFVRRSARRRVQPWTELPWLGRRSARRRGQNWTSNTTERPRRGRSSAQRHVPSWTGRPRLERRNARRRVHSWTERPRLGRSSARGRVRSWRERPRLGRSSARRRVQSWRERPRLGRTNAMRLLRGREVKHREGRSPGGQRQSRCNNMRVAHLSPTSRTTTVASAWTPSIHQCRDRAAYIHCTRTAKCGGGGSASWGQIMPDGSAGMQPAPCAGRLFNRRAQEASCQRRHPITHRMQTHDAMCT